MNSIFRQDHEWDLQDLLLGAQLGFASITRVRCMGKKNHGSSHASCSKPFNG